MRVDEFFAYARKRQTALHNKKLGIRPHVDDPIIQHYKFCNVFREDDVTTIWFRENVREQMRGKPEVLLATILFRWFNRIETGQALFDHHTLDAWHKMSAFNWLLVQMQDDATGDEMIRPLKEAVIKVRGKGPYVTGAYCIIGAPHMPKLDGILRCFQNVLEGDSHRPPFECRTHDGTYSCMHASWQVVADQCIKERGYVTLEAVWNWFRKFPRSGDFMAYEVVTDLMHTDLLNEAPDRMTWANAGPGAIRGLNRIHGRPLNQSHSKHVTNEEMRRLLVHSQGSSFWPQRYRDAKPARIIGEVGQYTYFPGEWPDWDMRTVEHTLCEFDKYERIRLGEGSVKGIYRG